MVVGERDGAIGGKRGDEDDAENGNGAAKDRFRGEQSLIGGTREQPDVTREGLGFAVLPQQVRESTRGR